ncbi:MAG: ATP-binding cassette domain-containing protein [Gammaproteobacteria bacterium]|nr:ATP-binding cassette domain-containing protein [Gammaproteobacteria bacterium]
MLKFTDLALRRGATLLFEEVTFTVHPGQKVGLTGANGSGKSSLFSLIRGSLSADQGDFSRPAQWEIAEVAQETQLTRQSAVDYVIDGDAELRRVQSRLGEAEEQHLADDIAHCHIRLEEIDGYHAYSRAAKLLSGLGFNDDEIENPLQHFSGGWIMRLNLARALMCRSDLLLLDEPTNHLDLDAVIWLEQWLKHYRGTLLLISHDRDFLDSVVGQIAHVEQQGIRLYSGNYSAFEEQRVERLAQQQAGYVKQQQSIAHMQSFIDRFKAKATKAKQAQSRIKALERMQLIAPAHIDSPFRFRFKSPKAMPSSLLRIDHAAVGYDDITVLEDINFSLIPGERIGLLGLNGAGKSTLIKLLAGELGLHSGQMVRAKELRVGYFAQHQVEQLDPEASAFLTMQRLDEKLTEREVRTYLGGFNFSNDKVLQNVGSFSGGEKARLVLALIIWQSPNLLLLDEPTNHLDLEMRLALNEALQGFEGSVILVSHDRHLLRSVSDDLWLVDNGKLTPFNDDIDAYPRWLAMRKSGKSNQDKLLQHDSPVSRKLDKQQQAELRKQLQPQIRRLKRVEREVEKLSRQKAELEQSLAESSIYEADNKQRLTDVLAQQATTQKELQILEEEWFELSEELEGI